MTKVLPFSGQVGGGSSPAMPPALPEGLDLLAARTEEVEALFGAARRGELPRSRPLKPWEPATLNEQHLQMILLRAGGVRQNRIAAHFEFDQSRVSVILNHPDAQYILDKLGAVHAVDTLASHRERIAALRGPALDLIEDFVFDEDIAIEKRVPRAFDLLRLDDELSPKAVVPPPVSFHVALSGGQLGGMLSALRESREIEDGTYVVLADEALPAGQRPPGGGVVPEDADGQPGPVPSVPERGVGEPPHQQFSGAAQHGEAAPGQA